MKKVTEKTVTAFKDGKPCSCGNSIVKKDGKFMRYFLFGNEIARLDTTCGQLCIWDCGWQSQTTKERLSGILQEFRLGTIRQKDWTWYYERRIRGDYMNRDELEKWSGFREFDIHFN